MLKHIKDIVMINDGDQILLFNINKSKILILLTITFLGIGIDQTTKIWAQNNLAEYYISSNNNKIFYPMKVKVVIPNIINVIYKENPAAAFSITRSIPHWFRKPMLITISSLATLCFLFWYMRIKDGYKLYLLPLLIAGALGNLSDRIRLGYVIDFIDIHASFLGYHQYHWPTFNMADILIVIGALGILIEILTNKA